MRAWKTLPHHHAAAVSAKNLLALCKNIFYDEKSSFTIPSNRRSFSLSQKPTHRLPPYSIFDVSSNLQDKACGAVALKTVLDYLSITTPPIEQFLKLALSRAYSPTAKSWQLRGLWEIAQDLNANAALMPPWRSGLSEESIIKNLGFTLQRGPCLTFINPPAPRCEKELMDVVIRNGHRQPYVIAIEAMNGCAIYNDPTISKSEVHQHIPTDAFMERWTNRRIISLKSSASVL